LSAAVPLSVVMPVKDAEAFAAEAVRSVFAQTFGDFELIVVDDGSTDRTMEIVRSIVDSRLRVAAGPRRGVAAAINGGLREARGDLVARMDADDVSEPERFRVQMDFLRARPEVQVVGSDFVEIDSEGKVLGRFAAVDHAELAAASLLVENPLLHSSVMARAGTLRDLGGYRETASEDYELWCRLTRAGGFLANIPSPLIRWRWHERAVTKANAGGVRRSALETYEAFSGWFNARGNVEIPAVCANELSGEGGRTGPLARRMAWIYARLGGYFFERNEREIACKMFELSRQNGKIASGFSLDLPLKSSYPRRRLEVALKKKACSCPVMRGALKALRLWPYRPLER